MAMLKMVTKKPPETAGEEESGGGGGTCPGVVEVVGPLAVGGVADGSGAQACLAGPLAAYHIPIG